MSRCLAASLSAVLFMSIACASGSSPEPVDVRVTIENVGEPGALGSSTSDEVRDILLSPGIWGVHTSSARLFEPGEPATSGLTMLAEQGDASLFALELSQRPEVTSYGGFPPGADGASYDELPIRPGDTATFDLSALSDERLSIATMFIHSNDVLVATPPEGLVLDLEPGQVVDVSSRLELWDAGTERNEEPGFGDAQPMQGPGGERENGVVHRIEGTDAAGWSYPDPVGFVRVTLERR